MIQAAVFDSLANLWFGIVAIAGENHTGENPD